MKIELSNKMFYTLIGISIILVISIGVYAYGTSNPQAFGHSAGEIDWNVAGGIIRTDSPAGTWSGLDMFINGANRVTSYNDFNHPGSFAVDTNGIQRLLIDANGNVGIGTTNPGSAKLFIMGNTGNSGDNAFDIGIPGISYGLVHFGYGTTYDAYIRSGPSGRVVLQDTGGNVGIGTGDPTAKLDVDGDLRVRGAINPSGSAIVEELIPGDGYWGSWSGWTMCPTGTYVCGVRVRIESGQGKGDDTAMNGIRLRCCKLGS